jgi:hypothetical protein
MNTEPVKEGVTLTHLEVVELMELYFKRGKQAGYEDAIRQIRLATHALKHEH